MEESSLNVLYSCAPFLWVINMNDDIYFMELAIKEAEKAFAKGEIPIGAVIVKNNRVIAKGYNLKETKHCATKHAEIIVIEKACKKLKNWRLIDCTIYITMFPCPMCASAINQARIKKIVYGTKPDYINANIVKEIVNDKNYGASVDIEESVLKSECTKLLKSFFIEKR